MYLFNDLRKSKDNDNITTIATVIDKNFHLFLKKRSFLKTVKSSHGYPYTLSYTSGNIFKIKINTASL